LLIFSVTATASASRSEITGRELHSAKSYYDFTLFSVVPSRAIDRRLRITTLDSNTIFPPDKTRNMQKARQSKAKQSKAKQSKAKALKLTS
jgi:hypothetical protein